MIDCPVLLAVDIEKVIGFLVPIVFFVIYALNQLLTAKAGQQQRGRPQRGEQQLGGQGRPPAQGERPLRPPQAQQPQQPQQQKPQGDPGSQLNAEIEQFLKRAGQRRGERPARQRASRAAAPQKAPPKPPREEPVDVQPIQRRDFDAVSASVEKHLARRGFTERAEHLADDIERADEQMEEHLQKAFSHQVGRLSSDAATGSPVTDVETAVRTDASTVAAGLAATLASPQGMRQAIVLAEILARPEHRW